MTIVDSIFCVFGPSHARDSEAVGYTEKAWTSVLEEGWRAQIDISNFCLPAKYYMLSFKYASTP
jgi:hypothetical protein